MVARQQHTAWSKDDKQWLVSTGGRVIGHARNCENRCQQHHVQESICPRGCDWSPTIYQFHTLIGVSRNLHQRELNSIRCKFLVQVSWACVNPITQQQLCKLVLTYTALTDYNLLHNVTGKYKKAANSTKAKKHLRLFGPGGLEPCIKDMACISPTFFHWHQYINYLMYKQVNISVRHVHKRITISRNLNVLNHDQKQTSIRRRLSVWKRKVSTTHKHIFIHQASKAEIFGQQVIKGVDCDSSTCKCKSFHVTSLCPTQSQNTSLGQHIQWKWVYALKTMLKSKRHLHSHLQTKNHKNMDMIWHVLCYQYKVKTITQICYWILPVNPTIPQNVLFG